jgi:hypothetical protein
MQNHVKGETLPKHAYTHCAVPSLNQHSKALRHTLPSVATFPQVTLPLTSSQASEPPARLLTPIGSLRTPVRLSLSPHPRYFLYARLALIPWRWKRNICLTRRNTSTKLRGFTSYKSVIFMIKYFHLFYIYTYIYPYNHCVYFEQ